MKLRFDELLSKANGVIGAIAGIALSIAVIIGSVSFSKRHVKELLPVKKEEKTVENKKPTSKKKSSSKTTTKAVDCSSETK